MPLSLVFWAVTINLLVVIKSWIFGLFCLFWRVVYDDEIYVTTMNPTAPASVSLLVMQQSCNRFTLAQYAGPLVWASNAHCIYPRSLSYTYLNVYYLYLPKVNKLFPAMPPPFVHSVGADETIDLPPGDWCRYSCPGRGTGRITWIIYGPKLSRHKMDAFIKWWNSF